MPLCRAMCPRYAQWMRAAVLLYGTFSERTFFFLSCQGQVFNLHKKTSTRGSKIKMFFLSGTGFWIFNANMQIQRWGDFFLAQERVFYFPNKGLIVKDAFDSQTEFPRQNLFSQPSRIWQQSAPVQNVPGEQFYFGKPGGFSCQAHRRGKCGTGFSSPRWNVWRHGTGQK